MVRFLSLLSLTLLFATPGVGLYDCGGEVTDADGDGYPSDVDCDDTDPDVNPGQIEPCVCDGIDQDCNGVVDDFPCAIPCVEDADGDGFPANEDCDDSDPTIFPGQEEPCVCDQIDQNCNGEVDDFPCDIACPDPGQVGDVCGDDAPACAEGLVCCYPCGIPDCDFICQEPCDESEPWCGGGCPLVP